MAALVRFRVPDPQNVLDTYGAGALTRLERDTTSAMTGASELTTIAVAAGTTEHEYRDETGVAGTHWYRLRYSKASPSVAADYSGYGPVFQAGSPGGEVLTLEAGKRWANVADNVDDPWLPLAVGAINRAIIRGIGLDIGPSPDTVRILDGRDATDRRRRLWIPGGLRTFTTVEVRDDSTAAWETVTADVRIGPPTWERAPGEPGAYLEFIDEPAGSWAEFPRSMSSVRITGPAFATFGWDAYPDDLVHAAAVALQRMSTERDGRGQWPTETDAARYLRKETLMHYRTRYIPMAG